MHSEDVRDCTVADESKWNLRHSLLHKSATQLRDGKDVYQFHFPVSFGTIQEDSVSICISAAPRNQGGQTLRTPI